MRKDTRFKFNAYLSRVAELNGVDTDDVAKKFTVEPSVTQTLMTTLQASSAFLTKINIVPVDELKGEKSGSASTVRLRAPRTPPPMTSVRPLISLRSNPTNTNARKSTLISIFVTNSSTCGRVSGTFRPVSVTRLSSVSRSISSYWFQRYHPRGDIQPQNEPDAAGCRGGLAAEISQ